MRCPFKIKICIRCKKILVANDMNFYKSKVNKDNLENQCKKCKREKEKENKIFKERLKENGNPFDNIDINKVWNHCPFCIKVCAYSGEKLNDKNRSTDHIIPLDKGGLNVIWNLVPMVRNYNCSKHTKDMIEWYKQQEFYSEERLNKIYKWQEYAFKKWGIE